MNDEEFLTKFLTSNIYGRLRKLGWVLIFEQEWNKTTAELYGKKHKKYIPKDARGFVFVDLETLEVEE